MVCQAMKACFECGKTTKEFGGIILNFNKEYDIKSIQRNNTEYRSIECMTQYENASVAMFSKCLPHIIIGRSV